MYSFPKILAIGTPWISTIFSHEVEITEKIDGSQFVFGRVRNEVYLGSKRKQLFFADHEKMFAKAVDYVDSIQDRLPEDCVFYTEFLNKPKHNALTYGRVPKNGLYLFGVHHPGAGFQEGSLQHWAKELDIDPPNILYSGWISHPEDLLPMMETESYLGGVKIEGLVVKNYQQSMMLGNQFIPIMSGKYVSEAFKEIHGSTWGKEHSNVGRWQAFKDGYKTDARWMKAVQHLKEEGKLTREPKDIGALIKEVIRDIEEEEKETIKDFLWKHYGKEVLRTSTHGLPEWFKENLLLGNI